MVKEEDRKDKRSAASLAKTLTMMCVRNTFLEELHCGSAPVTRTGDYSDVTVVHPEGETPWSEVSRLDDDEMKRLMKQIVNRIYTFFLVSDDYYFSESLNRWAHVAEKWDPPEMDEAFLRSIEEAKAREAAEEAS